MNSATSSMGRITTRTEGNVGWIVFDNPGRNNAVSFEMWSDVPAAVGALVNDDSVRVIVVRGEGDKAFVSGADTSQFESHRSSPDAVERWEDLADRGARALYECQKPTIAMIHGYCIGGGVGIALSCDLRIAATDAVFSIPAGRVGLGYRISAVRHLLQTVGPAKAKEIFFTADRIDAQRAARLDLVNEVVATSELHAHVNALAARIAALAPLTLKAFKKTISHLLAAPGAPTSDECDSLIRACFDSGDYVEGRRALAQRRAPVFMGR